MYKQKLTLDPKLAGICEATLTIYDPEPLQQETSEKAGNFKVLGCSKLSDQEMKAHKLMRAAAPLAAGQKDVAVTELKCISVEGDVLPAEFQMHYEFHVANYSDEAIDYLPITIYFNTPDHALVEQDTTTITGIPAGWYQALEFTFPGVVAGQWMMTLEANKSREIVESNYENNKLSKIFTYINQPELVAESIAEVNGRTDFPLNESTEFEFVLSNLGPVDAEHVPIDFPVTFIDNSGRYSNIMASYVVQNIPAQRRSRAGFNITFQKPALCQMKLRIDKDGTINEISRKNNDVASEWYSIDNFKPNPPTGGDPEPNGEQKLIFPFKKQYVSTGYKGDAPAYEYGYSYGPHYGIDMYANGDTNVYASGYGEIVDTEEFNSLGNVLAVKYTDVLDHDGKNIGPIILRYCHLASIEKYFGFVKPGDKIAVQGASGAGAKDKNGNPVYHLHLEADSDTAYPSSTPSEGGGVDTTIDPLSILYKTKEQVVEPDCEDEKSAVDEEGRPWYDIDKITSIPTI